MVQPPSCTFCGRPRGAYRGHIELFYLVDISGPYIETFDASTTDRRSANRKQMWGCHDCVNVIQDTEYWARWDEKMGGDGPYTVLDQHRRGVLPLLHRHPAKMTPLQAATKYPPQFIHAKDLAARGRALKTKQAVNE